MRCVALLLLIAFGSGCLRPYQVNREDLQRARQTVEEDGADPYVPALALADGRETWLRVRKIRRVYDGDGPDVEVEAKDAGRGLRIAGLANLVPAAVILGLSAFRDSEAEEGESDYAENKALAVLGYTFGSLMAVTGGVLLIVGLSIHTHESDGPQDSSYGLSLRGSF